MSRGDAPIRVLVRYFASAADAAGDREETVELTSGTTVGAACAQVSAQRPRLQELIRRCRVARNDDFADDTELLCDGDELCVLPPVSGGAGAPAASPTRQTASRVVLADRHIRIGEACDELDRDGAGGVVTFTGVARRNNRGQKVHHLDFEAHTGLAVKELGRIIAEAIERFGLIDARVLHRLGRCAIGEVAVDIAVSGAHRAEAFAGCQYVIDELKKRAPIWKRETTEDGASWLEHTP